MIMEDKGELEVEVVKKVILGSKPLGKMS